MNDIPDVADTLTISGRSLDLKQVCRFCEAPATFDLRVDDALPASMERSVNAVRLALEQGQTVYGINTGFGGMSDVPVAIDQAAASQNNLLVFLAAGAGPEIDRRHVRAAMLLRANVLARGHSGVRFEIVRRLHRFLQADAMPIVRELGSIGASGDLVPLATIGRAITGQTGFVRVRCGDRILEGQQVLHELGLSKLELLPKEGLAIVNGTSFSSAVAANAQFESRRLMALTFAVQGMMLRALLAREEPFDEFVHRQKPHPGQLWSAAIMRQLLREGREETTGTSQHVQDRYSLRCFPQYMGSIVEGIARVGSVVETEMNAVSDNPLIDVENHRFHQGGNFLGQYLAIAMDDLRRFLGLMAKYLDVQIASLVAPEFSGGLPASLRGNEAIPYNMGLKGLQITGNSIMPLLTWAGNPLVEHFPTHAEQFNQNINGLSWGSASLAWKSVELFQQYLAVACIFAVQALDLRAKQSCGHYDGRVLLGTLLTQAYEAVCGTLGREMNDSRPLLFDDADLWLEEGIAALSADMRSCGALVDVVQPVLESFDEAF